MSTKTNFKRVALVAVAALGLGVLTSVAPANATMSVGTSTGVCASDTGAPLSTIAMSKTGSLVITHGASADDTVKVTGVLYITAKTGSDAISVDQKKLTVDATTAGTTLTIAATGPGAGTIYTQTDGAGAVTQTVNVTVLDSCAGAAVTSAANNEMIQSGRLAFGYEGS